MEVSQQPLHHMEAVHYRDTRSCSRVWQQRWLLGKLVCSRQGVEFVAVACTVSSFRTHPHHRSENTPPTRSMDPTRLQAPPPLPDETVVQSPLKRLEAFQNHIHNACKMQKFNFIDSLNKFKSVYYWVKNKQESCIICIKQQCFRFTLHRFTILSL